MKKQLLLIFAFISFPTYAMFCPTNFTQIEIGDSMEKVKQQCGKPDEEKTQKSTANQPQEWNYYVKADPTQSTTMKMSVAFADNKVMNITVNGTTLVTTPICGQS